MQFESPGRGRLTTGASRFAAAIICVASWASCAQPELEPYHDLVGSFAGATVELQDGSSDSDEILADPAGERLFLPAGVRVSWAFFAEPTSSLVVERLATRGNVDVIMTLEADDSRSRPVTLSPKDPRVRLRNNRPRPVKLTLETTAAADASTGAGALFVRPEIRGRVEHVAPEPIAEKTSVQSPNVFIYLVDTLRRDRLGTYGYNRPTSPAIDEFASRATVFSNSHAQSTWTKPTVSSLFTGVWPPTHGATGWRQLLPEEFSTIAEQLRDAGYATGGFVTNVNASQTFGVAQGFETSWYKLKAPATTVNDKVFEWLDSLDLSTPLFAYLHTMEPHAAYRPKEPFRSRFAPNADEMPTWKPRWRWPVDNLPFFNDLYDGEIAQNDDAFGVFISHLDDLGLLDDALVIFLSDHGEEFREHNGWRHGRVLHTGTLDVPMIIKFPGQREGLRSEIPVSQVDILPTVLDIAGLPPEPRAEGQSLRVPERRPVYSHLRLSKAPLQYSVIHEGWKLIRIHREEIEHQLFDITSDPGETINLAADLPVRTAALAAMIDAHLTAAVKTEAEERELSLDTERKLRALGYLQ